MMPLRSSPTGALLLLVVVTVAGACTDSAQNAAQEGPVTSTTSYVTRNGRSLLLAGRPYRFVGINAYSLATWWEVNHGCGDQIDDLDGFFSQLRPNSMVRLWAWQGALAVNARTKQLDWTGLDRVVRAAEQQNQKLILSLGSQSGTCDDGHWKDKAWYDGGYRQVHNDFGNGLTPLSYWDYVRAIVARYKDSPAVAMWELINEPEVSECPAGFRGDACMGRQTCPDYDAAARSLRAFFDTVGAEVKRLDPNHLIESGVIGNGQCGNAGEMYRYVHESPFIDVASYHDYTESYTELLPGDEWNGLETRLDQMAAIDKPLIIGESGVRANANVPGCMTPAARRDLMKAKMDAQFRAGVAGFLVWNWVPENEGGCHYETITAGDPLMALLAGYTIE
jgi:mannan endo-1,4-beta-mannosidase